MIEVHNNPAKAKCDGAQSLTPDQFDELMQFIGKEVEFFGQKNELNGLQKALFSQERVFLCPELWYTKVSFLKEVSI